MNYNQNAYFAPFSQQNHYQPAYQPAMNHGYQQQPQTSSYSYSTSSAYHGPTTHTSSHYTAPPQHYSSGPQHGYAPSQYHAQPTHGHYAGPQHIGQIMHSALQPAQQWFQNNVAQPVQQFAQRHPAAAGLASGAAAGMGMGAITGCPYAGASAALGAAAPYMDQIGQAAQNGMQHIGNTMVNTWNNLVGGGGHGHHATATRAKLYDQSSIG